MIILGLPCSFCNSPTVAHCGSGTCQWSRCPKCHSYGKPGEAFVQWHKDDYINPYTLSDIVPVEPEREFKGWLVAEYGKKVEDGG